MRNQDSRQVVFFERLIEPSLALRHSRRAPLADMVVGFGLQEHFVRAQHLTFAGPRDSFSNRDVVGPKAVVVECEERSEDVCAAVSLPDREGIFRGEHLMTPAEFDEGFVARDPAQSGLSWGGPELVIAGYPD